MNNPFDLFSNEDARTEAESRRLRVRMGVLLGLFCCLLLAYLGVLYNLQVVKGDDYRQGTALTVTQSERVDTVRGEIVDRYGNVLVTNAVSYHVTLDPTEMGSRRNEILSRLLELCRAEGVEWYDSFPVSDSAPWEYTREGSVFSYDTEGEDGETVTYSTLLGALAKRLKWVDDPAAADLSAQELMAAMCKTFGIPLDENQAIDSDTRALLGVLYELSLRTYEITYADYTFAEDVDIAFITKVKERSLDGVNVELHTARRYNTTAAAHVLGRVAAISAEEWPSYREQGYRMNELVGKQGVELAFESYLRGTSGVLQTETDENGTIVSQQWKEEPQPGGNVVLTLDSTLQSTTEELLAQFVSGLEEPGGAAAVMVDMTGGVLALASYPTYDLSTFAQDYNDLLSDPAKPLLNRATMGLYAPGSTFKMVTAVAGLTEGIITPSSTVYCGGIYTYYPDTRPVCWIYTNTGGSHGTESVTKAITDSCNIFFYDVGRRVGIKTLVEYATKFGLGQYTGIEIAEYKGNVAGPETSALLGVEWYAGSTMYAAIGQENNQFTPLQLANYIATLVNGGNHYQAHLLKEVKSGDYSQTVYEYEPVLLDTIDIDPAHLAAVKQGMYDLSQTYSMARYFSSLPVTVGCKTGTAEVTGASNANAVFVCFAPYDNPQVAICLVAERGSSGGSLAAVAAGMLAQYFATDGAQNAAEPENTLLH
ncbi:MAG: penicillin-binding transpeptidase domain-containing protein [Candidatus Enterenecus sp.]